MHSLAKTPVLFATALLSLVSCPARADSITATPAFHLVQVGQTFGVSLLASVSDLSAYQLALRYNPAVISVASILAGDLFPGVGFGAESIDTPPDQSLLVYDTLAGPGPGVSGTGTLLRIYFTALTSGISSLDLSDELFLNSDLNPVILTLVPDSIVVTDAPEPATGSLLIAALWIVVMFKRWSHPRSVQRIPAYEPGVLKLRVYPLRRLRFRCHELAAKCRCQHRL